VTFIFFRVGLPVGVTARAPSSTGSSISPDFRLRVFGGAMLYSASMLCVRGRGIVVKTVRRRVVPCTVELGGAVVRGWGSSW
jgi:hypothetical protein